MKTAKRIPIAHPPLRLNYVASFAIRSIPHYPDGRKLKRVNKCDKERKKENVLIIKEICILSRKLPRLAHSDNPALIHPPQNPPKPPKNPLKPPIY